MFWFQYGCNANENAGEMKSDMTIIFENCVDQLMNRQQEAITKQQQLQQTMKAQMNVQQQQMAMQQ